jgi:tRNA (adenine37-N6)-methyltransferase
MNQLNKIEIKPIGIIRTPFNEQKDTPIQSVFAGTTPGEIIVDEKYAEALTDLDGFERIWVIYNFDRACEYKDKVIPYRDREQRGLFATRAPARPNPIGMSVLRLKGIVGCTLKVEGVDMLDRTPVIDIKPYVPEFDSFPDSRAGWLDERITQREHADGRFDD